MSCQAVLSLLPKQLHHGPHCQATEGAHLRKTRHPQLACNTVCLSLLVQVNGGSRHGSYVTCCKRHVRGRCVWLCNSCVCVVWSIVCVFPRVCYLKPTLTLQGLACLLQKSKERTRQRRVYYPSWKRGLLFAFRWRRKLTRHASLLYAGRDFPPSNSKFFLLLLLLFLTSKFFIDRHMHGGRMSPEHGGGHNTRCRRRPDCQLKCGEQENLQRQQRGARLSKMLSRSLFFQRSSVLCAPQVTAVGQGVVVCLSF